MTASGRKPPFKFFLFLSANVRFPKKKPFNTSGKFQARIRHAEWQLLADINRLPPTYCAATIPTHKVTEFAPPLRKSD